MKKTLLVAAMMASFTGAAVAQNSVTLYGRINPSFDYTSIKFNDKAASTLGTVAATRNQFQYADGYNGAGSLWGLKGVEDLGNGLKASFQFEQAFTTTTGAATTDSGRVAALTFSNSAWGSVGFGRDLAAANTILAGIDALGAGAFGFGNATRALQANSQRYSNQVKYLSPTISGFRVGLSYSFNGPAVSGTSAGTTVSNFGTSTKNRVANIGLRYTNGPLAVAALYTQINPKNGETGKKISNWTVGGTYDLKVVKLHAGYGQNNDGFISRINNGLVSGSFGTSSGTGAILIPGAKSNQYSIGLSAPVGASGKVAFSFAQIKPGGVVDVVASATQTTTGISYTYSMSKRTSLYAGYSYSKNIGMIDGIITNQIGGGVLHTF